MALIDGNLLISKLREHVSGLYRHSYERMGIEDVIRGMMSGEMEEENTSVSIKQEFKFNKRATYNSSSEEEANEHNERYELLVNKYASAIKEIQSLKTECDLSQAQADALQSKVDNLQAEIEDSKKENDLLLNEISNLKVLLEQCSKGKIDKPYVHNNETGKSALDRIDKESEQYGSWLSRNELKEAISRKTAFWKKDVRTRIIPSCTNGITHIETYHYICSNCGDIVMNVVTPPKVCRKCNCVMIGTKKI